MGLKMITRSIDYLTKPQQRALKHLAKYQGQWRQDTPTNQRCLNNLKRKGLVKVAYDDIGWSEMITPAGIIAIEGVK